MKRNQLRIAVQKEGRLKDLTLQLLASQGFEFPKTNGRMLIVPCRNSETEILYVRHSDIPQYVQSGAADFGIVGENVLSENNFKVKEVQKLDFGQCRLALAVPVNSHIQNIKDLEGERIATSYPNSLRKFLQKQKINAVILKINGAVEAAPALGLADAICDLIQTGNTLKENDLKPLATILDSTAILIESPFENERKKKFMDKFYNLSSKYVTNL